MLVSGAIIACMHANNFPQNSIANLKVDLAAESVSTMDTIPAKVSETFIAPMNVCCRPDSALRRLMLNLKLSAQSWVLRVQGMTLA